MWNLQLMNDVTKPDLRRGMGIDQIDTDWAMVHEPAHIVLRYATAIQHYLNALIKNKHDAEEVAQDFFVWVSENGLPRARKDRGRFRDYLKTIVRNNALNFLTRKRPHHTSGVDLRNLPTPGEGCIPDQEWILRWRSCLLNRAWRRLKKHQERTPDNLFYTVLRLSMANSEETSQALADRIAQAIGKPIRAEAFRKQLSRARRMFAQMLVKEIARTLDKPSPEQIEEELLDLGLLVYVRDYLPLRRR
jgi:RNA polymerase sigma-70 factor (ECF subfamily)